MKVKVKLLIFKCFKCNKDHEKNFKEELVRRFWSTYKFWDGDINRFCLMLKKEFILTNTWIVGKDLTKQNFRQKKNFTVT